MFRRGYDITADFYERLGVTQSASAADIKAAYRKLMKKYHPDVNKAKDAERKYKETQDAYDCLSDTIRRSEYDRWLRSHSSRGSSSSSRSSGSYTNSSRGSSSSSRSSSSYTYSDQSSSSYTYSNPERDYSSYEHSHSYSGYDRPSSFSKLVSLLALLIGSMLLIFFFSHFSILLPELSEFIDIMTVVIVIGVCISFIITLFQIFNTNYKGF